MQNFLEICREYKWYLVAILLLGVLFWLRMNVFALYVVNGGSMCNSLNFENGVCDRKKNQLVLLLKPQMKEVVNGSIVVFEVEDNVFIKRVVGKGGDVIEFDLEGMSVFDSEKQLLERREGVFVYNENSEVVEKEVVVPEGQVYLVGDNSGISLDSRNCFNQKWKFCYAQQSPFVAKKSLRGVAVYSLYPAVRSLE